MTIPFDRQSATARLRAGHLASQPRAHHGARLADAFRHDPTSERLASLRDSDPAAYAALPAGVKVGVAYYAAAKAAAAALGRDISAPTSTP